MQGSGIKQVDSVASRGLGLTVGPDKPDWRIQLRPRPFRNERTLEPWLRFRNCSRKWSIELDLGSFCTTTVGPPDKERSIPEGLQGAYFAIVCDMLDSKIITTSDFDLLISVAVDMKPPFSFMNSLGVSKSLELVEAFAKKYPSMPVSKALREQAAVGKPWEVCDVLFEKKGDVGIITIRRPKALNALNSKEGVGSLHRDHKK